MSWGVYVHIPFCARRCPYCAFVLIESDGSLHDAFVDRLCREIRETPHRPDSVSSLYFGGGTPSLLTPKQVGRIYDEVSTILGKPNLEVTLEANPEDITEGLLKGYKDAGVNRLSLGIQALDDRALGEFGREHSAKDAEKAWKTAHEIFPNVSLDLMFGLGGQQWSRSLDQVLSWSPPHVSLYGLTYEPGTPFTREVSSGVRSPISPEREGGMYREAISRLTEAGYRHYEISNFAKPGMESVQNTGYWEGRPYLGFGPGAHSYIPHQRWSNLSNVRKYLEGDNLVLEVEELTLDQRMLERIFLGLRRDIGVDLDAFQVEFKVPFREKYLSLLEELEGLKLVHIRGGFLVLTENGKLLADEVIGKFA